MVGIITANSSSEGNEEYEVIPLALSANTLKFGLPSIFHSGSSQESRYQVHKAIAGYMLERFKQISMSSDPRQMVVRFPSDGRQIPVRWSSDPRQMTLHAHFKLYFFFYFRLGNIFW
jgi:hypothetical protein